jgi:hypothetical protein
VLIVRAEFVIMLSDGVLSEVAVLKHLLLEFL